MSCRRGNNPFGHNPECDQCDIDGVDRDTDTYLEWADEMREAEFDRQLGASEWSR